MNSAQARSLALGIAVAAGIGMTVYLGMHYLVGYSPFGAFVVAMIACAPLSFAVGWWSLLVHDDDDA